MFFGGRKSLKICAKYIALISPSPVSVFFSFVVTFAAARSKLKKAEATSDVQTEPENSQRQLR